jgi:hypothetical protein
MVRTHIIELRLKVITIMNSPLTTNDTGERLIHSALLARHSQLYHDFSLKIINSARKIYDVSNFFLHLKESYQLFVVNIL